MESFNAPDQDVQPEQSADQLTFTVGNRQFDVESAAKKISAADEHISRLEAERAAERQRIAELEAQLAQSTKLEEALQKLQADKPESRSQVETPYFDPEKLSATAREAALAAIKEQEEAKKLAEQKSIAEQTFKDTQAKLAAIYGTELDKAVEEHAGVSLQTALKMAQDPEQSKALLRLMKVPQSKPSAPPSGSLNTVAIGRNADQNKFLFEPGKAPTNKQLVDILLKQ